MEGARGGERESAIGKADEIAENTRLNLRGKPKFSIVLYGSLPFLGLSNKHHRRRKSDAIEMDSQASLWGD